MISHGINLWYNNLGLIIILLELFLEQAKKIRTCDFANPYKYKVGVTGFEPAVSAPLRSAQSRRPLDVVRPLRPELRPVHIDRWVACIPINWIKSPSFGWTLHSIGVTGFEPATSTSRISWRILRRMLYSLKAFWIKHSRDRRHMEQNRIKQ